MIVFIIALHRKHMVGVDVGILQALTTWKREGGWVHGIRSAFKSYS